MANEQDVTGGYSELRRLAAEDPRRARAEVAKILSVGGDPVNELFREASGVGEGRMRQLIANVLRERSDSGKYASILEVWRSKETDEFARRAIETALRGGSVHVKRPIEKPSALVDEQLIVAYRYAASRLKHQLRNVLMEPMAILLRLKNCAEGVDDLLLRTEVLSYAGSLNNAMSEIGRVVEFDPKDSFFEPRLISLQAWLDTFNKEYGRRFRAIPLRIEAERDFYIRANDYLLNTIFWNLWINAQQAVGSSCEILVTMREEGGQIQVIISDNGVGIDANIAETAFQDVQPRKGHSGRGLLEIQDAAERLQGAALVTRIDDGTNRIMLFFPVGT